MAVKIAVTAVLTACFCLAESEAVLFRELGAAFPRAWQTHFFGQFMHANLFHLLANVCVLWQLRFTWRELPAAYVLSIPATFATTTEAVGFSSVLYALMGMRLREVRLSRRGWAVFILANAATAFVPSIAFGVHAAAFAAGWAYGYVKGLCDEYRGACKRR